MNGDACSVGIDFGIMGRALRVLGLSGLSGLSGLFVMGVASTAAFAGEPTEDDPSRDTQADVHHNTEEPKKGEQPVPVIEPGAATGTPVAAAIAPPSATIPPAAKPKAGDLSITGYFRGGFGAVQQESSGPNMAVGGRMTCFSLSNPAGLVAKYRLGNECEVWSETHFTMVTYVGDDGVVSTMHFMPTVYIPSTNIGYTPNGTVTSPSRWVGRSFRDNGAPFATSYSTSSRLAAACAQPSA